MRHLEELPGGASASAMGSNQQEKTFLGFGEKPTSTATREALHTRYKKSLFCTASECLRFTSCPEALTPGREYYATHQGYELECYPKPTALGCYRAPEPPPLLFKQPKTRRAAEAIYGNDFDPARCIRAIEGQGTFWQCGHPAGKGGRGLYCGRHVTIK
jgi:hypothetical protein